MRMLAVSAAALALALPAGAMAQSTTPSTGSTSAAPSGGVPMDQNSAGTVGSRFHGMDAAGQDKVRKSLEQAGFTNIRILDSAYLVQAQGANGEAVTMVIDTAGPGGSAASGSSSGGMGGMTPGGSMGGMGTHMGGSSGNSATTGTGPGGSTGTGTGTTTTK